MGAAITSINAVLITARQTFGGVPWSLVRTRAALVAMLMAAGAVAGTVFTALQPLRRRGEVGRYLGWILSAYVVLACLLLAAGIAGDENAWSMVTNSWGLLLLVVSGALGGIVACRVIEE